MGETIILVVVFTLFGLETLSRFGAWWFAAWRDFTELRETLLEDDDGAEANQNQPS